MIKIIHSGGRTEVRESLVVGFIVWAPDFIAIHQTVVEFFSVNQIGGPTDCLTDLHH